MLTTTGVFELVEMHDESGIVLTWIHTCSVGLVAGVSVTSWVTGADGTPSASQATIVIVRGSTVLPCPWYAPVAGPNWPSRFVSTPTTVA